MFEHRLWSDSSIRALMLPGRLSLIVLPADCGTDSLAGAGAFVLLVYAAALL